MNKRGRLKQKITGYSRNPYPTYNNRRQQWEAWIPGIDYMSYGNIERVLSDVVEPDAGFYYPYNDGQPCMDNFKPHVHELSWLLCALVRDPENFSIDGFEEYYSKQEQEFITAAKKKLVAIKDGRIGERETKRKRGSGKCWLCGHELVERNTPHYHEDKFNRIIIVKNVPTTVCSFCGDKACFMEVNEKLRQRMGEVSNVAERNRWSTFVEIDYVTGETRGHERRLMKWRRVNSKKASIGE